jgi:hypothetical protein
MVMSWALTIGLMGGSVCCISGAARRGPGLATIFSTFAAALMASALIAMAWPWGMNVPALPQVIVFALVAILFMGLATRSPARRWSNLQQVLMAGGMISMTVTAQTDISSPTVVGLDAALAVSFAGAGLAWLAVAIRRRRLVPEWMGNVLMSFGMTAVLLLRL